jgi:hypothetical protein
MARTKKQMLQQQRSPPQGPAVQGGPGNQTLSSAMAHRACCASLSLESLPGPALQLIDQFVSKTWRGRGRIFLLRTCRTLRDIVLAGSKSIMLKLQAGAPADMAARLLRRACAAAAPGLRLSLKPTQPSSSTGNHLLYNLLEPLKDESLPSVHVLVLQVCWCMRSFHLETAKDYLPHHCMSHHLPEQCTNSARYPVVCILILLTHT